ncbi:MAG: ABC transporter ATP-binding protein/permease [Ilumatobacteraceae bacterium]|nr:ABC transporter ATP-binding protein/permease [Ilumatobacteraceae bacterium]MDP4735704.1 ABC transporter ATP-binding protein/permease [Ilumatobacteraceae bacterium]
MSFVDEEIVTRDSTKADAKGRLGEAAQLIREVVRFHPRLFLIAVLGAALFAVCTVASSIGLKWMIDRVILVRFESGKIDLGALVAGSVIVIGIGLLRALGVVIRRSFAGRTEWRTCETITEKVIDHIVGQPIKWHRQKMTGDIVARCGVDADASVAILAPLPFSTSVVVMMVVSASWMLYVDIPLGLLAVIVFPILLALNIGYQRRIDRFYNVAQKELGTLSEAVHESFDGVMVVKSFGAEVRETERLAKISLRLKDARISAIGVRSVFEAMLDVVPTLINILLIVLGAYRVKAGEMSVGDLSSFIYLFTLLIFPLRIIGYLFSEIPHSVAGWRRICEVLDEQILDDPNLKIHRASDGIAIEIRELCFSHQDGTQVLNDLSMKIESGKIVALVGATGSGKSTLLHLISGLIEPSSGSVAVQEGGVALVFQEAFLFAESLRYNITLDSDISTERVMKAITTAQCQDFVSDLEQGLETVMGERGVSLSGGQRQRVALARAIAHDRPVLLLDDTTSALDPKTESNVIGGLRGISTGHTLLIVASRPSTIALADEVLFMADGRIVDRGTHESLLKTSEHYRLLISAFEHDRKEL